MHWNVVSVRVRVDMAEAEVLQRIVQEAAKLIGVEKPKDEQEKAMVAFASGQDVLVSLPTLPFRMSCTNCPNYDAIAMLNYCIPM